jgi:uncharacterized glyoxalase superfamily protein PhnB
VATLVPSLYVRDVAAHLAWLEAALGFETSMVVTNPDGSLGHCETSFEGMVFNIGREWADWSRAPGAVGGANTQTLSLEIQGDLDEHCARARGAGATILDEPQDQWYGHRTYSLVDPEGHVWRFVRLIRAMSFDEMGRAGGRTIRERL